MCCETLLDVYLQAGKYRLFDVIVPCLGSTVVVDSHSAAVCPSRTLGSVDTTGMQVARTGKFFCQCHVAQRLMLQRAIWCVFPINCVVQHVGFRWR